MKNMRASDVTVLVRYLHEHGVDVWLDGGWAVDALLGEVTRPHADLDVVVEERQVGALRQALEARGYRDVPRDDTCAWNFVLGDDGGREVDIHVVVLDEAGNGRYGPAADGVAYPAAALTGSGTIDGLEVRCVSAAGMVAFMAPWVHVRGEPYRVAIAALCDRFGVARPKAVPE